MKLHAGMSGKYALVSEWLGNQLGRQLNIKTQTPIWINLEREIQIENIHIEVKELIYKSLGLNIGFLYQKEAKDVNKSELRTINYQQINEIFLFDLMMINIDRTPSNINLMKVENEVIPVDYESSLLFQEIIGNKNLLEDDRILHCLKSNPLYREIDEKTIDQFIEKISRLSTTEIIAEIPLSLLRKEERLSFAKGIANKQSNNWYLKETMNKLKSIEVETKDQQKRRVNKNQEDFKRKFKENAKSKTNNK